MTANTSATSDLPGQPTVRLVGEVVRNIHSRLSSLGEGWVEGELGDRCAPHQSGHYYLTLRDPSGSAALQVILWANTAAPYRDLLRPGARVQIRGRLGLHIKNGAFFLYATEVVAVGLGALLARIEETKLRLVAEGLTSATRKAVLPVVPAAIGVIAAAGSAALADVREVSLRRWPSAELRVAPVTVQGPRAVEELLAALERLETDATVEVIIVTRGGGSAEDLLPFSDETLCRAVAQMSTPVVSAVGHETDSPLLDLVADARAATPTDAACLVTPDTQKLRRLLDDRVRARSLAGVGTADRLRHRLHVTDERQRALGVARANLGRQRLSGFGLELASTSGPAAVNRARHRLDTLANDRQRDSHQVLADARDRLGEFERIRVSAAGPAAVQRARYRLDELASARDRTLDRSVADARGRLSVVGTVRARLHPAEGLRGRRDRLATLVAALARRRVTDIETQAARLTSLTVARPDAFTAVARRREQLAATADLRMQLVVASVAQARAQADRNSAKTTTLSPLAILKRGYALVSRQTGALVRDPHEVVVEELVSIRVAEGSFTANVVSNLSA